MSGRGLRRLRTLLGAIPDPELPVLTLDDLGVLRGVEAGADGRVLIRITPTYTGCPALDPIREDVARTARAAGYPDAQVRTVLAPRWSSDWMSAAGRAKLARYGIAPPDPALHGGCPLAAAGPPRCPHCGSTDTREVSRFGATPCQAQHVCNACREPFARFKTLR